MANCPGGVYLYGASRNVVELATSWATSLFGRPFRQRTAGRFAAGACTREWVGAEPSCSHTTKERQQRDLRAMLAPR